MSERQTALLEVKAKIEEALNGREAQRSDPFANGLCQAIWIVEGMLDAEDEQRTIEPPVVLAKGSGVKLIWPGWEPFHRPAPTPEEECDGSHPLVRHDGTLIYLYDLVAHPDCPHQPWVAGEDDDALAGYAEASRNLAGSLRKMTGLLDNSPLEVALGNTASAVAGQLEASSHVRAILWPSFNGKPVELCAPCYWTPSGTAVHVRPGCRC